MIEDVELLMNVILDGGKTVRRACEADAAPELRPAAGVLTGMVLSSALWLLVLWATGIVGDFADWVVAVLR